MKILDVLDIGKNELKNVVVHKLAANPSTSVEGQLYYNTVDKALKFYNGTTWSSVTESDLQTITGDSTLTVTESGGDVTIGISTSYPGQTSITTVGTIGTGVWNGSPVPVAYGGTGADNATAARTNLGTVSKSYVDAIKQGLFVLDNVRVATTENLASLAGLLTLDTTITLVDGDRVLVKDQTDKKQNGLYVASATGWTRTSETLKSGVYVFVTAGTRFGDAGFILSSPDGTITIGASEIVFTQFSGAGQIVAGDGITKVGNIISAIPTNEATLNNSISIGTNVGTNGDSCVIVGSFAGASLVDTGELPGWDARGNTLIGYGALNHAMTALGNTVIGSGAGAVDNGGSYLTGNNSCVFIGINASGTINSTNEITIGKDCRGAGSNTVTLGNPQITDTYLRGSVHLPDLQLDPAPSIAGHVEGRMYYDPLWKTISADVNQSVTLQLGQEEVRLVYNNTGVEIANGKAVYTNGVHTSVDANLPSVATIALAKADADATSAVLGVTTEVIAANDYGFVTVRGHVNGIDTTTMSSTGEVLWLSADVAGDLTVVKPTTPNRSVRVGRLIVLGVNGRINVRIFSTYSLDDLGDVEVSNPLLDQVIRYNGASWVNSQPGAVSAGAGIDFFFATPVINSRTLPPSITATGSAGNGIQVNSLSKTPVTTTEQVQQGYANNDTRAFAAWLYNTPLGKTKIDAGTWQFDSWVSVNDTGGGRTSYATRNTYQVVPVSSGSVSITGTNANSRTATITSGQFSGTHFAASATNTTASYLQTPTGIYQISAISNTNTATIIVPTGYSNETSVTFNVWNKLFGVQGGTITAVYPAFQGVTLTSTQSEFGIATTDKLGQMSFFTSNHATTFYGTYNGQSRSSRSRTPLVPTHNDLAELQGGVANQFYHLTANEHSLITKGISAFGTDHTATATDSVMLVSGNTVITLPEASLNTGRVYHIKKTDATNVVTIDGNAGELIDGDLTKTITYKYECVTIVCDGSAWWIL